MLGFGYKNRSPSTSNVTELSFLNSLNLHKPEKVISN